MHENVQEAADDEAEETRANAAEHAVSLEGRRREHGLEDQASLQIRRDPGIADLSFILQSCGTPAARRIAWESSRGVKPPRSRRRLVGSESGMRPQSVNR